MIKSNFSGERLRSARMYRGITLTELAKRCNLNKQCISFYENNLNTPDYSKVQIIAKELNFPYDYFFQENGIIAKEEITYFRSLATATKRARISQSIKLQYVAKIYEILMNFISFPKLNLPQFDFNGNEKEIKQVLKLELEKYRGIVKNVVLGCTHYPLVKEEIKEILGENIEFFDGSPRLALHLKEILKEKNLLNEDFENYKNDYNLENKIKFIDSSNDIKKEKRFFEILEKSSKK